MKFSLTLLSLIIPASLAAPLPSEGLERRFEGGNLFSALVNTGGVRGLAKSIDLPVVDAVKEKLGEAPDLSDLNLKDIKEQKGKQAEQGEKGQEGQKGEEGAKSEEGEKGKDQKGEGKEGEEGQETPEGAKAQ
ncbi:hypothetical protein BDV25DRAFT_141118 [Aspergillus avenaceus]|uniref:Collagen triple helix repeat protein n=1 Tax=Aspergillus avenaceus TaxID=36643 RepID=A0A5N6TRX9_ASPAV|nr:hypothetical protein BDV25DRAFT_141118 [Aspergillus avenaceus]